MLSIRADRRGGYDGNDAPVASISIAALRSRLGPARSAMLGNRLMQASRELARLMD